MMSHTITRTHSTLFTVIALLCCLIVAQPALADRWVVPAAANVAGSAGTNWP